MCSSPNMCIFSDCLLALVRFIHAWRAELQSPIISSHYLSSKLFRSPFYSHVYLWVYSGFRVCSTWLLPASAPSNACSLAQSVISFIVCIFFFCTFVKATQNERTYSLRLFFARSSNIYYVFLILSWCYERDASQLACFGIYWSCSFHLVLFPLFSLAVYLCSLLLFDWSFFSLSSSALFHSLFRSFSSSIPLE